MTLFLIFHPTAQRAALWGMSFKSVVKGRGSGGRIDMPGIPLSQEGCQAGSGCVTEHGESRALPEGPPKQST